MTSTAPRLVSALLFEHELLTQIAGHHPTFAVICFEKEDHAI